MSCLIETRGLNKKFKNKMALGDVNLQLERGRIIGLLGPNGSGKSTLLKLMTKIIYPTKGKVITYGKLTSLLELGAGFHQDFTGRENIYLNGAILGYSKREIEHKYKEIVDFDGNKAVHYVRSENLGDLKGILK